jgi:FkbM family methyltransferase
MNFKNLIAKLLRRGVLPILPSQLQLPFTLWMHINFEDAEAELVHLVKIVSRGGVAIDVGANIGLYSLSLARYCKKVYAFEINPETSQMLKDCKNPKIEVINSGLSNHESNAILYTPVQPNGLVLIGWASLQPGNCPGITDHKETHVNLRTLDSFSIQECSFLKIDVEGHEIEVLEGAMETLRRTRPIILVEVKENNATEVAKLLTPLGYSHHSFLKIAGISGSTENKIFISSGLRDQY